MCFGVSSPFRRIIPKLVAAGAQGIILGCTEIGLLVNPEDSSVSPFDTRRIDAPKAIEYTLRRVRGRVKTRNGQAFRVGCR